MTLVFKRREPAKAAYTIFDALHEFAENKRKGVLMLVHTTTGKAYRVVKYDISTRVVSLQIPNKRKLSMPTLSDREAALYSPLWR